MTETNLLKNKTILIVDDDADILTSLSELLAQYEPITACTFEQAKELIETQKFDIAILDIMGVNGYELLGKTRIPGVV